MLEKNKIAGRMPGYQWICMFFLEALIAYGISYSGMSVSFMPNLSTE